ncbi:MAG: patatin-like phospholipase family protein, partial [Duncaniella sp.]|nr:patatin-like phospholipase family protein [Duncaniella sp.]
MRERLAVALMALFVALAGYAAEAGRPRVGLVLSGGGAKGIAHIGVIQAFEENGIPIDYITGTSMGAIVGGLYASGYSPAEMMELVASPGFSDWSKGKIDPARLCYFMQEPESPSFVNINLGKDSTAVRSVLPKSQINHQPMNLSLIQITQPTRVR